MGQELECRMQYQKRSLAGKAYLETDHILFRGDERVKIALKDVTSVIRQGGRADAGLPGRSGGAGTGRGGGEVGAEDPSPADARR